jgi:outer membrane protein assembly factor BamB
MRPKCAILLCLLILIAPGLCSSKEASPTFHGNNLRTGHTSNVASSAPALLWKFRTDASVNASPVIGPDGTIFLASTDGRLYALTQIGAEKWSFQAKESIFSTPAIGGDGTIYFSDLAGNYYALNPDGTQKWIYSFSAGTDRRITASPAVTDGGISYVPSWNNQLCAITPAGNSLWCASLKGMLSSSPALDSNGDVYIAGQDVNQSTAFAVYKFAPDSSTQRWKFSNELGIDRNRAISTPAIDTQRNCLYVGMTGDSNGILYELRLNDGSLVRQVDFVRGILSSPAIGSDGTLYVGSLDGSLYAIDPDTGKTRWQFDAEGNYLIGSPTVDGAGNIYIGDSDGILYALSPAGKELWHFAAQSNIASAPVIGTDGKIYFTSFDGYLYVLGNAAGDNIFYFPQVADGMSGNAKFQTTLVFANTGADAQVQVEFFNSAGQVMPVTLGSLGADWSFTFDLKKGESFSAQTPGTAALRAGYARVTTGAGVGGTAVYSYSENGVTMFEAGVPEMKALNSFTLFMDSRSPSRATALALANAGMTDANATLRLYDADFRPVAEKSVRSILGGNYGPGMHMARYAWEIFPEINRQGIGNGVITVDSDQPLACATLQQDDDSAVPFPGDVITMSAFPVIPERADLNPVQGNPSTFYFPQIGIGLFGTAQLQTTLVLVNTGAETDALIEFFDEAGQPVKVNLRQEPSAASSFSRRLKLGQSVVLETTGAGTGQVGYARVTTTSRVNGSAVLKWSEQGTKLFEAGIPATTGLNSFSVVVGGGPNYSTGLAFVNTGAATANATLRLYDKNCQLIATRNLTDLLPAKSPFTPGAHLSIYAFQIFPELAAQGIEEGMIAIVSDQPLAAVTLRQRDDPGKSFPYDVFLMSVFPVIPGAPQP